MLCGLTVERVKKITCWRFAAYIISLQQVWISITFCGRACPLLAQRQPRQWLLGCVITFWWDFDPRCFENKHQLPLLQISSCSEGFVGQTAMRYVLSKPLEQQSMSGTVAQELACAQTQNSFKNYFVYIFSLKFGDLLSYFHTNIFDFVSGHVCVCSRE